MITNWLGEIYSYINLSRADIDPEEHEEPKKEVPVVKVVAVKKDELDGLDGNEPPAEEKKEEEVIDQGTFSINNTYFNLSFHRCRQIKL